MDTLNSRIYNKSVCKIFSMKRQWGAGKNEQALKKSRTGNSDNSEVESRSCMLQALDYIPSTILPCKK